MKNNKFLIVAATLLLGIGTVRGDATMPAGMYYFDFSEFTDYVYEVEVFNDANTSYILFDSGESCNENVTPTSGNPKLYRNDDGGLISLALQITTGFTHNANFIQVRHGANNTTTSWTPWATYSTPTNIGTESDKVFVYTVHPDGSYTWGTSNSALPVCAGVDPLLSFTAGEHGSLTTYTAGGSAISNPQRIPEGTTVHLVATPADGYAFYGWRTGSGTIISTASNYVFSMPATNLSLTAVFYLETTDPAIDGCAGCFKRTIE